MIMTLITAENKTAKNAKNPHLTMTTMLVVADVNAAPKRDGSLGAS
jgi:hypothetical protein